MSDHFLGILTIFQVIWKLIWIRAWLNAVLVKPQVADPKPTTCCFSSFMTEVLIIWGQFPCNRNLRYKGVYGVAFSHAPFLVSFQGGWSFGCRLPWCPGVVRHALRVGECGVWSWLQWLMGYFGLVRGGAWPPPAGACPPPQRWIVRQLVWWVVYIMFMSNNRPSFHLWWKENLVKHRKVSKYYETDCSHRD